VLRAIRADESGIYTTPVVVLSNADDTSTRLAAFHAGGDVYLTKPFRVDEVAMQVLALIALAARCRGRRDTFTSLESSDGPQSVVPGGHAIEGNVGQMSIATVLTLLEMEHRSGVLTISSRGRKCTLEMIGGCPAAATVGGVGVSPLALLRTVLRWKEGRFRFRPGTEGAVPSNRRSIGALLIEAVRLDDESAEELRDGTGEDEAPTARRGAVPSAPPPSSRRGASLGVAQKRASRPPVARPPRR
jgi:CheY-like chemotaxis protein